MKVIQSKGFTLIELIVTLVIIGIISVIAIPRLYSRYHHIKVLAAANQIVADIRYAQTVAMAEHDSSWVEFDDVQNLYKISSGSTYATRSLILNPFENIDFVKYLNAGQYKNVFITTLNIGTDEHISFDWFGNTPNSGDIVLNDIDTVRIEKVTGMVELVEW